MSEVDDIKHRQNINAIQAVHDCVDKLEKRFEAFVIGLGSRVDNHNEKLGDHEKRLYLLERIGGWMIWLVGGLAVTTIGLVVTAIFKLVLK